MSKVKRDSCRAPFDQSVDFFFLHCFWVSLANRSEAADVMASRSEVSLPAHCPPARPGSVAEAEKHPSVCNTDIHNLIFFGSSVLIWESRKEV